MSKNQISNSRQSKAIPYDAVLCGVNSHDKKQVGGNWKDCPKCKLEMTYGKLITDEWYCWNCNHKGKV